MDPIVTTIGAPGSRKERGDERATNRRRTCGDCWSNETTNGLEQRDNEIARHALGLPPEQTILGVPFYSRPAEVSYRDLVEADPAAAEVDEFDWHGTMQNYNGLPTIRAKTELAGQRAAGIMIWTIAHDTTDDTSLLGAIRETIGDR